MDDKIFQIYNTIDIILEIIYIYINGLKNFKNKNTSKNIFRYNLTKYDLWLLI